MGLRLHYLYSQFCQNTEPNIGWISQEEFFSRHRIQDFGYGGRAVVEAMGLKPAGDLISREYPREQVREENSF